MKNSLSPSLITHYLQTETIGRNLICLDTLDSTNNEARRRAGELAEGTVILCEQQTAGRGRFGREWLSPGSQGIWMTVLLNPPLPAEKVTLLTQVAAAAVSLALEQSEAAEYGLEPQIKWPNDILICGKKVGGILTEMQLRGSTVQHAILGIGLNVNLGQDEFPEELRNKASSLYALTGKEYQREPLIAGILNQLEPLYQAYIGQGKLGSALTICRERSAVIGQEVILSDYGKDQKAYVMELGPDGQLVVKLNDGQVKSIFSGEISLRIGN